MDEQKKYNNGGTILALILIVSVALGFWFGSQKHGTEEQDPQIELTDNLETVARPDADVVDVKKETASRSRRTYNSSTKSNPTLFDQIIASKTIRCGYVLHPPYLNIDPTTGEKSGVFYDIMEEIGRRSDLNIEWQTEVGWGDFVTGLQSGRFDMLCSGGWQSVNEAKLIAYSHPAYYSSVGVYVRADDDRFTGNLKAINSPEITAVSTDGSLLSVIARQEFPQAKISYLPNLVDHTQLFNEVVAGKADVVFQTAYNGAEFMKNNPDQLKNIAFNDPIRVFPTSLIMPLGELKLQQMINASLISLQADGFIDKVLDKYEAGGQKIFHRLPKPYNN